MKTKTYFQLITVITMLSLVIIMSQPVLADDLILSRTDIIGFGSSNEPAGTPDNPVIFRMDTEGNILWMKDLPFAEFDMYHTLADRNLVEDAIYLYVSAGGINLMDGKGLLQKYDMYGDLVWSLPLTTGAIGVAVSANPIGGGAYVSSNEGIWRIGTAGNILWGPKSFGFGSSDWIVAADALTGGVYATSNNGNILIKLDDQGNLLWQLSISSPHRINFSPTDGGVYVGAGAWGDDHIYKFDAQGNQQWIMNNFPSPWTYSRTVSSVDGALYVWSGWNEYLAKIMPDGTVAWSTGRSGGWGNMSVAADIEQNKVYTTEIFERLGVTAFNSSTGELLWQKDPGYYAPHWEPDDYGPLYWVYTGMPSQTSPDNTPPTITSTISGTNGNNGWYTSDVAVTWNVSDPESEIVSSDGCDTTALTGDTPGNTLTCSATNGMGLSNAVSISIAIDKTAPTITWVGDITNGDSYYFGFVPPAPACTASDNLSGLDGSCNVSGYASTIGVHTLAANAVDNAGNQAAESHNYSVLAWMLRGFYQPVDMNSVYNTVKGGSTVPLKFEIFAGSNELTDTANIKSLTYAQTACDANEITDEIETTATGGTSLRYDATAGQFVYNWKTPKAAGKCYRVTMTTIDGSSLAAYFKLK